MKTQALKIDREALLAQTLRGEFPDARGRFGPFGGRYVPETLMPAIERLMHGVEHILPTPEFQAALGRTLARAHFGQLLLALAGFGFVVGWFVTLLRQYYGQITGDVPIQPIAWLGEIGAVLFLAAWFPPVPLPETTDSKSNRPSRPAMDAGTS